jgi:uncharacterized protein (TIGR00369 family)
VGRTGIDFLRAIIAGEVPPAPIQFTLGFDLVEAEEGMARFRCLPDESHYNPMNGVHGGIACTLLDSAMGSAVLTTLDEKTAYTTVDLTAHLTRSITTRTGAIVAEGRVVHRGSRVATAEGRLTDERGRLLAHSTSTCLIIDRGSSRRELCLAYLSREWEGGEQGRDRRCDRECRSGLEILKSMRRMTYCKVEPIGRTIK